MFRPREASIIIVILALFKYQVNLMAVATLKPNGWQLSEYFKISGGLLSLNVYPVRVVTN